MVHIIDAGDRMSGGVGGRVAAGSCDYSNACSAVPLYLHALQVSTRGGEENLGEVRLEAGQDYLCLRIAEPAIELNDLWAVRCEHHTEIEHAAIGASHVHQALRDRLHDGAAYLRFYGGVPVLGKGRTEATHAAGIGAGVAVADALVVARRDHR